MVTGRHTSKVDAHGVRRSRRATRRTRGQTMFEFAIVMPLMAYLFCCIIDVGRVNLMWHRAVTAMEDAVQLATNNQLGAYDGQTGANTTRIIEMVCNELSALKVPIKSVTDCETNNVTFSDLSDDTFDGQSFTITVQFTVKPILPIAFTGPGPDKTPYNLFASYNVSQQRTVRKNDTTFFPQGS